MKIIRIEKLGAGKNIGVLNESSVVRQLAIFSEGYHIFYFVTLGQWRQPSGICTIFRVSSIQNKYGIN